MSGAKRRNFFIVPLYFFGITSTISRFGELFRDDQYSFVNFMVFLFYSRCPRAQLFVKVGARALCPIKSVPLSWDSFTPKSFITAIQSERTVPQGLFYLRSKLCTE